MCVYGIQYLVLFYYNKYYITTDQKYIYYITYNTIYYTTLNWIFFNISIFSKIKIKIPSR